MQFALCAVASMLHARERGVDTCLRTRAVAAATTLWQQLYQTREAAPVTGHGLGLALLGLLALSELTLSHHYLACRTSKVSAYSNHSDMHQLTTLSPS